MGGGGGGFPGCTNDATLYSFQNSTRTHIFGRYPGHRGCEHSDGPVMEMDYTCLLKGSSFSEGHPGILILMHLVEPLMLHCICVSEVSMAPTAYEQDADLALQNLLLWSPGLGIPYFNTFWGICSLKEPL